jgi:hypothetical protein
LSGAELVEIVERIVERQFANLAKACRCRALRSTRSAGENERPFTRCRCRASSSPPGTFARYRLQERLNGDRPYLQDDRFTVADAFAFFVLELCEFAGVSLERWPALKRYHGGLSQRPSIARAVSEELPLANASRSAKKNEPRQVDSA